MSISLTERVLTFGLGLGLGLRDLADQYSLTRPDPGEGDACQFTHQ